MLRATLGKFSLRVRMMLICAALLMFRGLPDRRHHLGRLRVLWLLLHAQPCDQPGHPNRQVDTKVDLPHVGYDFLGPPLDRVALICGETAQKSTLALICNGELWRSLKGVVLVSLSCMFDGCIET